MQSILMVEDEIDIQNLMQLHLGKDYKVDKAQTGKEAYNKLSIKSYQLLILDWMIPDINGLELLKWLRRPQSPHRDTPVLFVTAKSNPEDIVEALETGADDYLTKPYDFSVFKARVKNLLKRTHLDNVLDKNESIFNLGNLTLDTHSHKVFYKDQEIMLTRFEFRLLEILLKNQGKTLSRKQIINFIQGEVIVTNRTVDTHISILRKKLGDYGKFIHTVRGVGYRIGFI